MFELYDSMRQKESKVFAEILNRFREGRHTENDILKLREKLLTETDLIYLRNVPRFFYTKLIKAHNASQGSKYKTKAQDSAFGSNSSELKNKTDNATDPKWSTKTKQLASFLNLAEGERTEIAIIVRTDDGMLWYANAAGNVIKFIQLHDKEKPSSIVWVQFDDPHVGQKTTHDNKTPYTQEIHTAWTPVTPVTTQFAVGRNRAAQVIRRQFLLGSRQDHT